jgi:hypothetical protein
MKKILSILILLMFVATGCKINPSGGGGSSSPSTITHVFIG